MKTKKRRYAWQFPLPRTHTGVLQGNGVLGTLLWGCESVLRVTLSRADFWDRRGGLPWRDAMSYKAIRRLLEAGDEAGLRELFEKPELKEGRPVRPTVLPVGRFDLAFPRGWRLKKAVLDIDSGIIEVYFRGRPKSDCLLMVLDMNAQLSALRFMGAVPLPEVRPVPAWEYVGRQLAAVGFEPPAPITDGPLAGWVQARPEQEALACACLSSGRELLLSVGFGSRAAQASASLRERLCEAAERGGFSAAEASAREWWSGYWGRAASISVPNKRLQFLHDYGLYKFAGLTHPEGVAATLQGPWIEEYQLPPWSSDYHFNINVQMCYWPACQSNLPHHLLPLFNMIKLWFPRLKENARIFLGISDGYMLPHAVDDRGVCMGGFWTGSIDHGCTAWVADMMWRYYDCTGDEEFLAQTAYPFMKGAMRVYEEMIEEGEGGLVLPVSVSPEYGGSGMDAWGANASFQLACIHRLLENLAAASEVLGKPVKPFWRRIADELPKASLCGEPGSERIALWDGLPLGMSHRHHSHLAGIVPFDIFEQDESWRAVQLRSMDEWVSRGPGAWSGWCMPWASMLHTWFDNAAASELTLENWQRVFTNEGHGSLHDVHFPGYSRMGKSYAKAGRKNEIMQIEAGMGAVAAIQQMLLQTRRGTAVFFACAGAGWKSASFSRMLLAGGFLVSATMSRGRVSLIEVVSARGGSFRFRNPWQAAPRVYGAAPLRVDGEDLELEMTPGAAVTIRPPSRAMGQARLE